MPTILKSIDDKLDLQALESGGNLDTIAADTTSIDGKITACDTTALATEATVATLALESGGVLDDIASYLDTAPTEHTFAQLTAVGDSAALDISSEADIYHTVVLTVAGEVIDDADIRVQWSVDGTTWYTEYTEVEAANGVYETHWTCRCKENTCWNHQRTRNILNTGCRVLRREVARERCRMGRHRWAWTNYNVAAGYNHRPFCQARAAIRRTGEGSRAAGRADPESDP